MYVRLYVCMYVDLYVMFHLQEREWTMAYIWWHIMAYDGIIWWHIMALQLCIATRALLSQSYNSECCCCIVSYSRVLTLAEGFVFFFSIPAPFLELKIRWAIPIALFFISAPLRAKYNELRTVSRLLYVSHVLPIQASLVSIALLLFLCIRRVFRSALRSFDIIHQEYIDTPW